MMDKVDFEGMSKKELILLLKKQSPENVDNLLARRVALDCHTIVAVTDPNGIITEVNDKFCEISQYSRRLLIGKNHKILNSGFHSERFFNGLWGALKKGKVWQGTIKNKVLVFTRTNHLISSTLSQCHLRTEGTR